MRDPLATATRDDDAGLTAVVRWVENALIRAEEEGVTSSNASVLRGSSKDSAMLYLLGSTPGVGGPLRLDDDLFYRVIQQTGNDGKIDERDLGAVTPMRLMRGANKHSYDGGFIVSEPLR